jgi:hypothetical protein
MAPAGLGVDRIARRFRLEYGVGALTAYRWANDLTQLEVANAYSERFLGADERLFPQRVSEFEKWPRERGGREPPLSVLERLAVLYHTTVDRLIAAVLSVKALDDDAMQQPVGLMPLVDAAVADEGQLPSQPQGSPGSGGSEQLGHDLLDRLAVGSALPIPLTRRRLGALRRSPRSTGRCTTAPARQS